MAVVPVSVEIRARGDAARILASRSHAFSIRDIATRAGEGLVHCIMPEWLACRNGSARAAAARPFARRCISALDLAMRMRSLNELLFIVVKSIDESISPTGADH